MNGDIGNIIGINEGDGRIAKAGGHILPLAQRGDNGLQRNLHPGVRPQHRMRDAACGQMLFHLCMGRPRNGASGIFYGPVGTGYFHDPRHTGGKSGIDDRLLVRRQRLSDGGKQEQPVYSPRSFFQAGRIGKIAFRNIDPVAPELQRIFSPAGQHANLCVILQKTADDPLPELAGCTCHKNGGCHGSLTFRRCVAWRLAVKKGRVDQPIPARRNLRG
ncbi:hypothetical protein D3C72_902960 [compost metagenome]